MAEITKSTLAMWVLDYAAQHLQHSVITEILKHRPFILHDDYTEHASFARLSSAFIHRCITHLYYPAFPAAITILDILYGKCPKATDFTLYTQLSIGLKKLMLLNDLYESDKATVLLHLHCYFPRNLENKQGLKPDEFRMMKKLNKEIRELLVPIIKAGQIDRQTDVRGNHEVKAILDLAFKFHTNINSHLPVTVIEKIIQEGPERYRPLEKVSCQTYKVLLSTIERKTSQSDKKNSSKLDAVNITTLSSDDLKRLVDAIYTSRKSSSSGNSNSSNGNSNSSNGNGNSSNGNSNSSIGNSNSSNGNSNSSNGNSNSSIGNSNSSNGNSNSSNGNSNSSNGNSNSSIGNSNSKGGKNNSSVVISSSSVGNSNSCSGNSNSSNGNNNSSNGNSNSNNDNSNSKGGNNNSCVVNSNSSVGNNNSKSGKSNSIVDNSNSCCIDMDSQASQIQENNMHAGMYRSNNQESIEKVCNNIGKDVTDDGMNHHNTNSESSIAKGYGQDQTVIEIFDSNSVQNVSHCDVDSQISRVPEMQFRKCSSSSSEQHSEQEHCSHRQAYSSMDSGCEQHDIDVGNINSNQNALQYDSQDFNSKQSNSSNVKRCEPENTDILTCACCVKSNSKQNVKSHGRDGIVSAVEKSSVMDTTCNSNQNVSQEVSSGDSDLERVDEHSVMRSFEKLSTDALDGMTTVCRKGSASDVDNLSDSFEMVPPSDTEDLELWDILCDVEEDEVKERDFLPDITKHLKPPHSRNCIIKLYAALDHKEDGKLYDIYT